MIDEVLRARTRSATTDDWDEVIEELTRWGDRPPAPRRGFEVGMVEDAIPDQAPQRIALLLVDTHWYESMADELEHLDPGSRRAAC